MDSGPDPAPGRGRPGHRSLSLATSELQRKPRPAMRKERGKKYECPHGYGRYSCRVCSPQNYCEHGTKKDLCKECPQNLCVHDRLKRRCAECGGKSMCPHGRNKYYCVECKGNGICEHGMDKRYCKVCLEAKKGGTGLCEHQNRGFECRLCTSNYCKHNRFRKECATCQALNAESVCEHNRFRVRCRDCKREARLADAAKGLLQLGGA